MRLMLTLLASLFFSVATYAQDIQVQDDLGIHVLPAHPSRPVVLDWDLVEQVIELGVTPLGAPELDSYKDWVVQPKIPHSTVSIGTRSEPSLEQIAELKPDIIIASDTQKDLLPQLQKIAPVLMYANFSQQDQHAQVAIEQFKQLATVFGKQEVANQKLVAMDKEFAQLKARIEKAFSEHVPPVLIMRFANTTSTFIYSENSTPIYVLQKLGLQPAMSLPAAKWGIIQKPISSLQHIKDGVVLYFRPFNEEEKLKKSVLWRAM
ncbi:iron-siderophore ABC transporter substrate-binding protein, partial [Vibrio sp.]|nr:iron-siderophore ABC transporter substrate-binding protein [Vibrio sp.]